MKLKKVSFEVAKAIKEAGYPQGCTSQCYLTKDHNHFYRKSQIVGDVNEWRLLTNHIADIPTYIDVWLWLWREKRCPILIDYSFCGIDKNTNDPEEAIIAAINYLVDNNLIK